MFPPPPPDVPEVDPARAAEMMSDGAILIDVREADEWEEARIPGSEFKPMSEIQDWYETLPRDSDIILHCHTGGRSTQATDALIRQAGFDRVFNLTGGIVAWHTDGLPLDEGNESP